MNALEKAQLINQMVFSFSGSVILMALIAFTWWAVNEKKGGQGE